MNASKVDYEFVHHCFSLRRLVFLQKGARVILIGSPVDDHLTNDETSFTSFFEVPRYFDSAEFKILKYIVNTSNSDEFTLDQLHPGRRNKLYNACVTVNLARMEGLVRQALWESESELLWQSTTQRTA